MLPQTGRFQPVDRLRRSAEFQRVIRGGRRAAGSAFVVICSQQREPGPGAERNRLGITVSRKVGNAVVRNRVKRRIREWFRAGRKSLAQGVDFVVIGRVAASRLSYAAFTSELSRLSSAAARGDRPGGGA